MVNRLQHFQSIEKDSMQLISGSIEIPTKEVEQEARTARVREEIYEVGAELRNSSIQPNSHAFPIPSK